MRRLVLAVLSVVLVACQSNPSRPAGGGTRGRLEPVPFERVKLEDSFWKPKVETNRRVTVEACLAKCEETGRIANFARCGGLEPGPHQGLLFNDSDVYKVIEGAAYTLATTPDEALEARLDTLIDKIAAAQQPDGYLNTYYTMVEPAQRWKNIAHGHELYCAGHLVEAAVAYEAATGKRKLLDVALRLVDHIDATFGPGKKLDPPGHEELELALVKLWRRTQDPRHLALARFFVDQRGSAQGRERFGDYAQDHLPIREQREIVGHAVRAMYLYSGVADVAGITGDAELWSALDAIWHDVVDTKMYVTGGIGSSASNEGITHSFDLPNETAYCETCAQIGMALWNQRMFLATGEGRFADIVELELFNGFLSGVSASGDRFFYTNPLASAGDRARVPWFDCSCCPSNVVRFLPAIGERIYAHRGDELFVSQYVGSDAVIPLAGQNVRVSQRTEYPFDGVVRMQLDPEQETEFELRLRVPQWCDGKFEVAVAGEEDAGSTALVDGFFCVRRRWKQGDSLVLRMEMPPRRVYADPRVEANRGRVAIQRGPVVYCAEGVDNSGGALALVLPKSADLAVIPTAARGEPVRIAADAQVLVERRFDAVRTEPRHATLVPYYSWGNRGTSDMVTWFPESAELARAPGGPSAQVGEILVRASHAWPSDSLAAVIDGVSPKASNDHDIPRHTFWSHRGTSEWLVQEFRLPKPVSSSSVYWFDDTGRGGCRVPKSWRISCRVNGEWKPVQLASGETCATIVDRWCTVKFERVLAEAVRLEVELQPEMSAGVLEWKLE